MPSDNEKAKPHRVQNGKKKRPTNSRPTTKSSNRPNARRPEAKKSKKGKKNKFSNRHPKLMMAIKILMFYSY